MRIRFFVIFMLVGTILSTVTTVFLLTNSNPQDGGFATVFFFYLSLGLTLIGLTSLFELIFRKTIVKDSGAVLRQIPAIFRQSFLISIATISALTFASYRVLTWWNLLILVGLVIIIEVIIFTNRKFRNTDYVQ